MDFGRTPLTPIDTDLVASFWRRVVAADILDVLPGEPPSAEQFGDSTELADELLGLIVDGPKRATAGALVDFDLLGEPLPVVGTMRIAADGAGRPRAVLRTTDVRIGPLDSVDEAFAWDEGEGDRTRADWLIGHDAFFRRMMATLGLEYSMAMATVFERFEVLYVE